MYCGSRSHLAAKCHCVVINPAKPAAYLYYKCLYAVGTEAAAGFQRTCTATSTGEELKRLGSSIKQAASLAY